MRSTWSNWRGRPQPSDGAESLVAWRHPVAPDRRPQIEALRDFHGVWGYVAIAANAIAGLLALAAWKVTRLRGPWLWWVTIAAEVAILVQVVIGVILVSNDRYTVARFHMFYGFVAFVTVGLAYSYRFQMKGRMELFYGLVGLFLMGLGIRAVMQVLG